MIEPTDFFWAGFLPAIVAAGALAAVGRYAHKAHAAWLAGVTAGYLVGHWTLDALNIGWLASVAKSFRPHEARDWLPLAVLLAVAPEIVVRFHKRGSVLAWLLRLALCAVLPWWLLRGSAYLPLAVLPNADFHTGAWSRGEAIGCIGGSAMALLAVWLTVAGFAGDKSWPGLRSLLAIVVTLGGAATLAMSGSLAYGQLLGVLAATLAGCGLAARLLPLETGPEAASGPLVAASGSVLLLAYFFAELKLPNAIFLLLAMSTAVGWLPGSGKLSGRVYALLRCVVCLSALTAAVSWAALDFAASQAQTPSNPYLNFQP